MNLNFQPAFDRVVGPFRLRTDNVKHSQHLTEILKKRRENSISYMQSELCPKTDYLVLNVAHVTRGLSTFNLATRKSS